MKSNCILRVIVVQTYDELLSLAEKGDNSTVDAYFRSLRDDKDDKKDDFYDDMPGDALTFSFAHAVGKLPGMRMRTL